MPFRVKLPTCSELQKSSWPISMRWLPCIYCLLNALQLLIRNAKVINFSFCIKLHSLVNNVILLLVRNWITYLQLQCYIWHPINARDNSTSVVFRILPLPQHYGCFKSLRLPRYDGRIISFYFSLTWGVKSCCRVLACNAPFTISTILAGLLSSKMSN